MKNEFENIWKKAVVAKFNLNLVSRHLPGRTAENNEIPKSG
jgi:hypothetical protein